MTKIDVECYAIGKTSAHVLTDEEQRIIAYSLVNLQNSTNMQQFNRMMITKCPEFIGQSLCQLYPETPFDKLSYVCRGSNPSNPNVYVRHVTEMIESRDTKVYRDLKINIFFQLYCRPFFLYNNLMVGKELSKLLLNLHFCY